MGIVGPEQETVRSHDFEQTFKSVLPEGIDIDVALESVDRMFAELLRHFLVDLLKAFDKGCHPSATILDRADSQIWEAVESAVTHHRAHHVGDRPVGHDQTAQRIGLERQHFPASFPNRNQIGVARV